MWSKAMQKWEKISRKLAGSGEAATAAAKEYKICIVSTLSYLYGKTSYPQHLAHLREQMMAVDLAQFAIQLLRTSQVQSLFPQFNKSFL